MHIARVRFRIRDVNQELKFNKIISTRLYVYVNIMYVRPD